MADSNYVAGADLFADWRQQVLGGPPPKTWPIGEPFSHVDLGPGRIVLLGGPPATGKTALVMQWIFGALTHNPDLRIAVANVEMSPARLLDRQLARLSGISLNRILRRQIEPKDHLRLSAGFAQIGGLVDRIAFVQGPYDLERVAAVADDFGADLLVLDYLQRIELPGRHNGLREKMNALMSALRQLASADVGILAAAALTRSRDSAGRSSYDGKHLGIASFRESSELEYGCDDAFLLYPIGDGEETEQEGSTQPAMLVHLKSRDGEPKTISLKFHRRIQRFTLLEANETPVPSVAASVNEVWQGNPSHEQPNEACQQNPSSEQPDEQHAN
jgi:replicative DNA helicase